jgi:hypothetical protein
MEQFLIQISKFYHSGTFGFIKFILGIYSLVLIVDIILIIILREPLKDIKTALKGTEFPLVSKSKMQKRWAKVKKRLESRNISQWKLAILEADSVADKIMSDISFKGKNMAERLDLATPANIENLEDLRQAHHLRNQIIRDKEYALTREEAEKTIGIYEKFLESFEFL